MKLVEINVARNQQTPPDQRTYAGDYNAKFVSCWLTHPASLHMGESSHQTGKSAPGFFRSPYYHPDGRRVTVAFHSPGDTFKIKTLKAMIELQAKWTEAGLRRLKLIK